MFYVVWRWPTPSGSVRGWTRATSAATGSSSGPPPPRWRRWRAGPVSTAARSSPASAASPDMSVLYHCILTVCIVYNAQCRAIYFTSKVLLPPFWKSYFFPLADKIEVFFYYISSSISSNYGWYYPRLDVWIPKIMHIVYHLFFLFSYILNICYTGMLHFSLTFGHFTSIT